MNCPKCNTMMVRERRARHGVAAPNPNIEAHWTSDGWTCPAPLGGCGHVIPDGGMARAAPLAAVGVEKAAVSASVEMYGQTLDEIVMEGAARYAPPGFVPVSLEYVVAAEEDPSDWQCRNAPSYVFKKVKVTFKPKG